MARSGEEARPSRGVRFTPGRLPLSWPLCQTAIMKSCHAATLALLGWVLLIPHYGLDGRLLDSAALSDWKAYDHFDSRNACEQVRHQMVEIGHETIEEHERHAVLGQGVSQAAALLASKCVRDDDPRLKGRLSKDNH